MSWEQRNADFCRAQTDAQLAYIEAERRVVELEDENAKLRELVRDMWRFGFSSASGANSVEEHVETESMLHGRMLELGVEVG